MSDEISFLETFASLNKKQTRRLENLRTRRDAMDSKLDELESEMSIIKEETSVPRGEEVMFPRYWDETPSKKTDKSLPIFSLIGSPRTMSSENVLSMKGVRCATSLSLAMKS